MFGALGAGLRSFEIPKKFNCLQYGVWISLVLLVILAGCVGDPKSSQRIAKGKPAAQTRSLRMQQISYSPPQSEPPLPLSIDTAQTTWELEKRIAANVVAIPEATLGASRAGTVMTVLYAGDPRDFVDCGEITMGAAKGNDAKTMSASEDKLKLARTSRKPDGLLERTLRLDSRTTVRFDGLPGGKTRVHTHTRYVVTKEVHNFAFGGKGGKNKWLGVKRETIAFSSGEQHSFGAGTTCISTGTLEQALLAGLQSAELVALQVPLAVSSGPSQLSSANVSPIVSPVTSPSTPPLVAPELMAAQEDVSGAVPTAGSLVQQYVGMNGRRIALVIGNNDYRDIAPLKNPANDAELIASSLQKRGYVLIGGGPRTNLDRDGFENALEEFGRAINDADVAVFYYAGHGMQVDGTNWLVPVDAKITVKKQDLPFHMVTADHVLLQMEGAGTKLNLLVLDACRNNPLVNRGLRSARSGLAEMQAPTGSMIAYATEPGNVALDGDGLNSPYSAALAVAMLKRDLDIFHMFNSVGLQVQKDTNGQQIPWTSNSPIRTDVSFGFP